MGSLEKTERYIISNSAKNVLGSAGSCATFQAAFVKVRRTVCGRFAIKRVTDTHTHISKGEKTKYIGALWISIRHLTPLINFLVQNEENRAKLEHVCVLYKRCFRVQILCFVGRSGYLDVLRKVCVSLTRNVRVPTLESVYEMLCQSKSRGLGVK
jgi:hypothetical protein